MTKTPVIWQRERYRDRLVIGSIALWRLPEEEDRASERERETAIENRDRHIERGRQR